MYNPEKHHRRTVRLKNHNYNDGFYFVTVCCENRACIFGKIKNGIMTLNDYGKIAQDEWSKTADLRNNVKLHKFIIMPNHIHAIIEITKTISTAIPISIPIPTTVTVGVGARRALPLPRNYISKLPQNCISQSHKNDVSQTPINRFQNQGKNTLSSIIGAYKSAVSKQMHKIGFIGNVWQRNYHEHIIRDTKSYQNISKYIFNNPTNWQKDNFFFIK